MTYNLNKIFVKVAVLHWAALMNDTVQWIVQWSLFMTASLHTIILQH